MSGVPEIESVYSLTYKRINVAGMFGGIVAGGLEALVYSQERRVERMLQQEPPATNRMTVKRTVEMELIIDPMQMRSIHTWLGEKIAEYERVFGHIPSPEEVESRVRRHPQQ
jgi:hypothetical protein